MLHSTLLVTSIYFVFYFCVTVGNETTVLLL